MAGSSPKPIYVLAGRDDYLLSQHRREIIASVTGAGGEPGVTEFEGAAALVDVLDELRTFPLLAARRVVVVRGADSFVRAHCRQIRNYLDAPSAASALVLMVDAWPPKAPRSQDKDEAAQESPNARKPRESEIAKKEMEALLASLDAAVRKVGAVIDCSAPEVKFLPGWAVKAASARGKTISPAAVAGLIEAVGNDLGRLENEIEKLALFVGPRQEIAQEDVEAAVWQTAGPAIYVVSNAIAERRTQAALEALEALLVRKGDEFALLGLIAARLRWRLSGKEWGTTKTASPRRTSEDFRKVLRADLAMKSGADPKTTLQWLVAALCQ